MNHNEYAVSPAVSRMEMPPVREYASSLLNVSLQTGKFREAVSKFRLAMHAGVLRQILSESLQFVVIQCEAAIAGYYTAYVSYCIVYIFFYTPHS